MYLKPLLFCFFSILAIQTNYAQNRINGLVSDSLNKPIINASISLKQNGIILKYTKTDSKGYYILEIENFTETNLFLEARFLGYKPATLNYHIAKGVYNFTLKESTINLDVINVKHKPVIIIKGDTLNYRTADFANENDRSIGDVLKKMPGITVAENGKITYNDQPISKLYIDGDNLLDDKYNIGTKAIPHRAVTKIQVIEHDQPIKMLQKNNLSNDISLNLVIDKAAKLKIIGNAKIGAGLPSRYEENVEIMLFKQQIKFLDNISLNNNSLDLSEDIISHNNNLATNKLENNRPYFQTSTGVGNTPYLPKSRYLFNNSGIVNTNNLYKLSPEKQLKTNIYYLYDGRRQNTNYNTEINLPTEQINYVENQANKTINQSLYAQLNYIDNATSNYINNSFTVDYTPNRNNGIVTRYITTFTQQLNQKRFNVVNNLKYLQSLKSGTILNINSYLEKNTQTESLNITPGINSSILNAGVSYNQLSQQLNIPGFFTNNYIIYSTLKNKITQSYEAGFNYQAIDFNSNLQKLQTNNIYEPLNGGTNDVDWNKFKLYLNAGLEYKTEAVLLSFRSPLSLTLLNYNTSSSERSYKRIFLNPSFGMWYNISQQSKLNARYSYSENMGKIEDIFPGLILQNYRSLISNNTPLPFAKTHNASIGIKLQKTISMLFGNLQLSYTNTLFDNIIESRISNIIQTQNVISLDNSINNFSINGSIGKYFVALNTNLSFDATWSANRGKQLQNENLFSYKSNNFNLGVNISSKITNKINWALRSSYTNFKNELDKVKSPQLNQLRQFSTLNINIIKNLTSGVGISHIFINQTNQKNLNYIFSDINLKYKWLRIRTDIELGLNNLGNIKSFETYFININSLTATKYDIPGRNVLLKATFAFN
jgi:hypothetical protein